MVWKVVAGDPSHSDQFPNVDQWLSLVQTHSPGLGFVSFNWAPESSWFGQAAQRLPKPLSVLSVLQKKLTLPVSVLPWVIPKEGKLDPSRGGGFFYLRAPLSSTHME